MKLQHLTPMLHTSDIPATIAFYRDQLGFACDMEWSPEGGELTWCSLMRDDIDLMFMKNAQHEAPLCTGTMYIVVEDVRAVWEQLKDKAEVAWPLEEMKYGMLEFALKDNNGYLLSFGEPVAATSAG